MPYETVSGLHYARARMYNERLGRFMQTDPIGYGDGMNLYAYVRNDPINYVDPFGLEAYIPGTDIPPENGGPVIVVTGCLGIEINGFCIRSRLLFEHLVYSPYLAQLQGKSLNAARPPTRPQQPRQPQPEDDKSPCISIHDGPVFLRGGGGDVTLATGAGISFYRFTIPSTGAEGTVAAGSWLFGLGASLSGDVLSVDTFGQLLGTGYRVEASVGIVSGHVTFDAQGNWSGGGLSAGVGGGLMGGPTRTTLKSSNQPLCGATQ